MWEFLAQHQLSIGLGAFWVFSAAVGSLEPPDDKSGKGYHWLYKFMHTTAGNLSTAFAAKFPNVK